MVAEGDTRDFFGFFRFAEPLIAPLARKLLSDDLAEEDIGGLSQP